jgi:deoxyribonuclease-4
MIDGAGGDGRLGVCLDTCHLHAAGYDLARQEGYEAMVGDLWRCLPIERVRCIHVNDSVKPAGSRVDRHAHIGMGTIGCEGFGRLLRDERFVHIPKILETPKETAPDGRDYDAVNLEVLRRLAAETRGARGRRPHA